MEGIQENVGRVLYFQLESCCLTTLSFPRGKEEFFISMPQGLLYRAIHKAKLPLLWVLSPLLSFPSLFFSTLVGPVSQETDLVRGSYEELEWEVLWQPQL